jgi:hypothetical protein
MVAPSVAIAPVPPGADAQKDIVVEVARAVEADRGTGVRGVVVITVGANRRWSTDVDGDLRVCLGHHAHEGE